MPTPRPLVAILLSVAVTTAVAASQLTAPDPSTTGTAGPTAGTMETIGKNVKSKPDSTSVSLDAVSSNPGKYENQTLARRVTLGATRPAGGAVAIVARDAETGKRIDADLANGFSLVMTKDLADRVADARKAEAVVTFLVTKVPIPGHEAWIGVIARVDLLGDDGAVVKSISADR